MHKVFHECETVHGPIGELRLLSDMLLCIAVSRSFDKDFKLMRLGGGSASQHHPGTRKSFSFFM